MVDLGFLFKIMVRFGFPSEFFSMIWMLFLDASTSVKVNGFATTPFEICKGVHQGCPLVPYLFLLVAEVFNAMIKAKVESRQA
jgi:hypothetical protein